MPEGMLEYSVTVRDRVGLAMSIPVSAIFLLCETEHVELSG